LVSQLRENLLLCSSFLPLGVPNGLLLTSHQAKLFWRHCRGLKKKKLPRQLHASKIFSSTVAGEKEDFCKGSLARTIFYFVIVLLYFILASFYQKYKKN
jgi:hypothetical protein